MTRTEHGAFYPEPSGRLRLGGLAGIVGGILWPIALIVLGNAASTCTPSGDCIVDRGSLALAALAPVGMAICVLALELRVRRQANLGDLVGDLTIGTAAVLFALAVVLGVIGLIGPGLLLLLIGSIIFGIVGYSSGARQRLASALVAVGALAQLVLLFSGVLGDLGGGVETFSLLALLLFAAGWIWLGGHLLFARPLPIPEKQQG